MGEEVSGNREGMSHLGESCTKYGNTLQESTPLKGRTLSMVHHRVKKQL